MLPDMELFFVTLHFFSKEIARAEEMRLKYFKAKKV